LHAGPAIHRAENVRRAGAILRRDDVDVINISKYGRKTAAVLNAETKKATRVTTTTTARVRKRRRCAARSARCREQTPKIGSALPIGRVGRLERRFRLLSTGQTYRVEDYGWALSGRNTIDLYMSNRRDMNTWGARQEPIQVLRWGDPQQVYKFCNRTPTTSTSNEWC